MGELAVNNWTVFDGPGSNAKLVARAQGLHINAGDWHLSYSLVFENGSRYPGSTLQVMGTGNEKGTEWAVVGGTGELGMATGVIHKRLHEHNGDGNVFELTITGFYFLQKDQSPKAQKLESWGGSGGSPKDITEPPKRLQSISISSATVIDSIAFSYTDEAGKEQSAGPWGGAGGTLRTIQLGADEFVKEVSGTYGTFKGATVITSLKFVTNVRTWGPWGEKFGTNFGGPVKSGHGVAGFYVNADKYVDKIGLYIHPV
ncbi:protein GOS9-like isoform X2 [Panicum virgatum]|uniref:Dirigent protein n=2 Tax=Panicum virgatum TaxID=38727 RepID=A0A8T0NQV8_PANVG|nr:protein GOS9-like isoform X2 [Panicum virgatum]KAG2550392.1 hypothetical protein PVAP13_9KG344200 [Panicum virgatum]